MKILKFVGAVWAIIGAGNILLTPTKTSSEGVITFALIFNMVLFVFPGLALYGIGKNSEMRNVTPPKGSKKQKPITREEIKNWIIVFVVLFVGIFLFVLINYFFFKPRSIMGNTLRAFMAS